MNEIESIGSHWLWFGLALALLIAESFIGGFKLLAVGISAVIVGILTHLYPYVGIEIQSLFFLVLSGLLGWLAHSVITARKAKVEHLKAVYREQAYIGKEFVLDEPLVKGEGKLHIEGVTWKLQGPDCAAGQKVQVTEMRQGLLAVALVAA